jgi:hypothetical protein
MASGAAVGVDFLDPLVQAFSGAFTANPVYAMVIIVIAFIIGWLLHYQVFGY